MMTARFAVPRRLRLGCMSNSALHQAERRNADAHGCSAAVWTSSGARRRHRLVHPSLELRCDTAQVGPITIGVLARAATANPAGNAGSLFTDVGRSLECAMPPRMQIGAEPILAQPRDATSRPVSRVLSGGAPLRDGHSSGTRVAARLVQPTRVAGLETGLAPRARARTPGHPYLVLLPVGFALPLLSPVARCALTAPFHPCPAGSEEPPSAVCFLWHFPWGRPRRPLAATVFPWSPDFPPPAPDRHKREITGSGRPAGWHRE